MTMATGGIASVLHSLSYRSAWLDGVGIAFFIFNILLFITNCGLLLARFRLRPGSFMNSFTDQMESLFIPSFFVSCVPRSLFPTISNLSVLPES
ncbi:hypothetical protein HYQ44_017947 [Verticillium longisporum]|nr:hypothetical protein HYQ44_017947 [Verticillium longisporum]